MAFPEPVPLHSTPVIDKQVNGFAVVLSDGSLAWWNAGNSPFFHTDAETLTNFASGYFFRRHGEQYRIVPARIVIDDVPT